MKINAELLHLFISPGHNFRGRHGGAADSFPTTEVAQMECVAGRGVRGDRFFDYKPDFKGQITFFEHEVYESLCRRFAVKDKLPSAFRRNVITKGADLNSLIGKEFEIQGVRFFGTEACEPCHWMDEAFCTGAEEAMRSKGGLRARILTDGTLRAGH